ncbi:hypothetical protein ACSBM8_11240 [Sphingomonas sp. ASY06-1R]|uniref:hypothetical protein n=1 Tax=Sphingomonas sp. ASY06-1R TaxID=3445771 RepID=UPI003FA259A0
MSVPERGGGSNFVLIFCLHVVGLMVGVIVAAIITAHWFPKGNESGGFMLMGALLILVCGGLYWSLRRALRAPDRARANTDPLGGGRRSSRPVMPTTAGAKVQPARRAQAAPPEEKGGCLMLIGFTILIVGGGAGTAFGTYYGLNMIVGAIAPTGDVAYNFSLAGALIACLSVMFVLDRWCVRKTGNSVLELLAGHGF